RIGPDDQELNAGGGELGQDVAKVGIQQGVARRRLRRPASTALSCPGVRLPWYSPGPGRRPAPEEWSSTPDSGVAVPGESLAYCSPTHQCSSDGLTTRPTAWRWTIHSVPSKRLARAGSAPANVRLLAL